MIDFMSGRFAFLGQGDMEDDIEQLASMFEQLSLLSALQMSYYYGAYSHAAACAGRIDAAEPYLGTIYLWVVTATQFGLFGCLITAALTLICIKNLTDGTKQMHHMIYNSRGLLRGPYVLWVLASLCQCAAGTMEAHIRIHEYDVWPETSDWEMQRFAAIGSNVILFFVIIVVATMLILFPIIAHLRETSHRFNAGEPCAADAEALPWFADPTEAELRAHLEGYLKIHGSGKHRFADPNPSHFIKYVLQEVRSRGHETLSYLAVRRLERVFEEFAEQA